jgi:hypothetical protein
LWGSGSPLLPEVFAWMIGWAPESVYAAVEAAPSAGTRFLEAAPFTHHDERAIAWMIESLQREYTKPSRFCLKATVACGACVRGR